MDASLLHPMPIGQLYLELRQRELDAVLLEAAVDGHLDTVLGPDPVAEIDDESELDRARTD